MQIDQQIVVFDAADLGAESEFWAAVLDGTVDADDDWHTVRDAGGVARLAVQLAPDHVAPDWPDGTPQQMIHLDLHVADQRAARAEVLALGARPLKEASNLDAAEGFEVFADPAGHPFCICWG